MKVNEMNSNDMIGILKDLIQVDIDTVYSYSRVLDQIPDPVIRSRLEAFRDQHQKHITDISDEIRKLGGRISEPARDLKGYVIEAYTALGTAAGMKGTLKALRAAEELTNSYYSDVVSKSVPEALKDLLRKHFSDEKNHLEYIRQNLQVL